MMPLNIAVARTRSVCTAVLWICGTIAAIAVTFGLIVILAKGDKFVTTLDKQITGVGSFLNDDPRGLKGTFSNINAILVQVGLAADELRIASQRQNEYWQQTSKTLTKSVEGVNMVLESTNQTMKTLDKAATTLDATIAAVKDGPIAESTNVLMELRGSIKVARTDVSRLIREGTAVTVGLGETVEMTNALIAKSKMEDTLNNVNGLSLGLSQTGANVAETTGYIRDMFKPTKKAFWRSVLETLLPIGLRSIIPQSTIVRGTVTVQEKK